MSKRSMFIAGPTLLGLILFGFLLNAGPNTSKSKTVTGTLVDVKCYSMGGFVVNDHKDMKGKPLPNCAVVCSRMGIPVAVLDSNKKVHIIAGPASGYSKWMSMEVRLTGMEGKYAAVFIPETIEVKEKGKWVKKELPGAMM